MKITIAYLCDQKLECSNECKYGISNCKHTLDPKHAKNPLPKTEGDFSYRFEYLGAGRWCEIEKEELEV